MLVPSFGVSVHLVYYSGSDKLSLDEKMQLQKKMSSVVTKLW